MSQAKEVQCGRTAPHPEGLDEGCQNVFVKRTHNQKYCCPECTRIQTNANVMQEYYDDKDRRSGTRRVCSECKFTVLSATNPGSICGSCERSRDKRGTDRVENMMKHLGLFSGI